MSRFSHAVHSVTHNPLNVLAAPYTAGASLAPKEAKDIALAPYTAGASLRGILGRRNGGQPQVPQGTTPSWAQDQASIQAAEGRIGDIYGQEQSSLSKILQDRRNQFMTGMTTGPEGEAFRQKFNNLGILNSGAFSEGLGNQLGNLAHDESRAIQGLDFSKLNTMSDLEQSGLERQFSLEDAASGNKNQNDILKYVMDQQRRQGMGQGLGSLIGAGAGAFFGGPAGAGLGMNLGGSAGSMFSGLF